MIDVEITIKGSISDDFLRYSEQEFKAWDRKVLSDSEWEHITDIAKKLNAGDVQFSLGNLSRTVLGKEPPLLLRTGGMQCHVPSGKPNGLFLEICFRALCNRIQPPKHWVSKQGQAPIYPGPVMPHDAGGEPVSCENRQ